MNNITTIIALFILLVVYLLALRHVFISLRRDIRQVFDKLQAFRQSAGISAIADAQDEQQELQQVQEILDRAAARQAQAPAAQPVMYTDNLGEEEIIMDDDKPFKR